MAEYMISSMTELFRFLVVNLTDCSLFLQVVYSNSHSPGIAAPPKVARPSGTSNEDDINIDDI